MRRRQTGFTPLEMLRMLRIAPGLHGRIGCIILGLVALSVSACASNPQGYNVFRAMDVLETQAPADGSVFTKFHIPVGAKVENAADELSPILERAARRERRVGVFGSDAQLNKEVTLDALLRPKPSGLKGLTLVYMAPEQPAAEIQKAADRAGIDLVFLKYPRKISP